MAYKLVVAHGNLNTPTGRAIVTLHVAIQYKGSIADNTIEQFCRGALMKEYPNGVFHQFTPVKDFTGKNARQELSQWSNGKLFPVIVIERD